MTDFPQKQVTAVTLVRPTADPQLRASTDVSDLASLVLPVSTLLIVSWFMLRRRSLLDPSEAAFRRLARYARLGRRDVRLVRRLAELATTAHSAPYEPAALLVCSSAFDKAACGVGPSSLSPDDTVRLAEVRRRLFEDPAERAETPG